MQALNAGTPNRSIAGGIKAHLENLLLRGHLCLKFFRLGAKHVFRVSM